MKTPQTADLAWQCLCVTKSPGLPDSLRWHPSSEIHCPDCRFSTLRPTQEKPIAKPVDDIAEQIRIRAQKAYDAHAPFRKAEKEAEQTPVYQTDHTPALVAAGYSLRACRAVPSMHGQAKSMAEGLLPFALSDGTILLIGPTGRGKTVMATYFAHERIRGGRKPGLFVDARDIFARMKQCWSKGEDSEAITKRWRETPFLVIDEMQSRSETVWENNELDHLVNKRYAAMLPTVLVANYPDEKAAQESLGPRIIDRVRETGHLVPCDWQSYRG